MFDPTRPGPFYEDFVVGATLPALPSVTLTDADNAVYRAITGDQHALAADATLYRWVSGGTGRLANPGVVMHYSIGQTTMATRQAIANLYYRSVRVLRPVELGETLSTTTTVLGLKDSAPKGDQHRGKVWLGITTSGDGGPVVEYERCALVRARGSEQPGHDDDDPRPVRPDAVRRPRRRRTRVGSVRPVRFGLGGRRRSASTRCAITSISPPRWRGSRSTRRRSTATPPRPPMASGSSTAVTCRALPRRR